MVHADRLLSLEASDARGRCSMLDLFLEIDRILRPEVIENKLMWVDFMILVILS